MVNVYSPHLTSLLKYIYKQKITYKVKTLGQKSKFLLISILTQSNVAKVEANRTMPRIREPNPKK